MNKILIPLLLVVHFLIATSPLLTTRIDGPQSMLLTFGFMASVVIYAASFFETGRAKLVLAVLYTSIAYMLAHSLGMILQGALYVLALAGLIALVAAILFALFRRPSQPFPDSGLLRLSLAMWLLALFAMSFPAFAWAEAAYNAISIKFATLAFLAFLCTMSMDRVRKWGTPLQLLLTLYIGAHYGIPTTDLATHGLFGIIMTASSAIIALTFVVLGWAYVRFLSEERRETHTEHPATPGGERTP
ncbi:MAG: hypothetical protein KUA35_06605 [Pseudodesulfovibrio sp.]|uniref:Uncharacterized protein n=1 Tax=Pseudodesulfovibrio aespoeensis (strain ATCC 700646 / DSM 10631 / Aspo-2) TaxID=643562 RepID=E6VWD7_PSEA9|nr:MULTISPECIES: hypothetical protein [Pseudodesulfovibrio]MBU4192862.1 hypothetical protein [Pseudomonadota bacterium]ADU61343.1 hypothetical protein Daes_0318 [Pseudodesulfovibrio aespoeensis Aspo-2]MBU4243177.1 hypothetical protein [Pseudomonadota bacterium]MBU4378379.1 hypothetical protein [Pseudomonadota bacterium]MBU4475630.1 hypothetical protein [Pseudomonadota bacterium]